MSLTIEIGPDLEKPLREEADRAGMDAGEFALRTLEQRVNGLGQRLDTLTHLAEAPLLAQINEGLAQDEWDRYHELIERRDREELSPQEQSALIQISDRIEELNARRISMLAELARARGVGLGEVMRQLGIHAPDVG